MVGRPDAPKEQDIQLSGLGIMPEHCILELENNEVYLTPHEGARWEISSLFLIIIFSEIVPALWLDPF